MVSLDDTLRLLKRELRLVFPETRFSIRRSRGTGYGWVHVEWTDGPLGSDVQVITDAYAGAGFDAMTDAEHGVEHLGANGAGQVERIQYGTRGINIHRTITPGLRASVARRVLERCGDASVTADERSAWCALDDTALLTVIDTSAIRIWGQWLSDLVGRALRDPIGHSHLWE